MQLSYGDDPKFAAVWVNHGDKTPIPFTGTLIDRSRTREVSTDTTFQFINEWLSTQPTATQESMFELMVLMRHALETQFVTIECIGVLQDYLGQLYKLVDMVNLRQFVTQHKEIHIPSSIIVTFDQSTQISGTQSQTYDREQYLDLITLSLALRLAYPIFVNFISAHSRVVGNTYKEFRALSLLNRSKLISDRAMDKLRLYVDTSMSRSQIKDADSINVSGCGMDDFPKMILADIVVKKLSCADVRGTDSKATMISAIWQLVKGRLDMRNLPPTQRVVYKSGTEGGNDGGGGGNSGIEEVKTRGAFSIADGAVIQVQCDRWRDLAFRLEPQLNPEFLEAVVSATTDALSTVIISRCQLVLCGWVISPVFSTQALVEINKEQLSRMIGLSSAVLWHRGYHLLSGLVGATCLPQDVAIGGAAFTPRNRITDERMQKIELLYSHLKPKERADVRTKKPHMILTAINTLAGLFASEKWRFSLPDDQVKVLTGSPHIRVIPVHSDIANVLAQYVIDHQ